MIEAIPPNSIHQRRLVPLSTMREMGDRAKRYLSKYVRKVRALGFMYRSELGGPHRQVYVKRGTALVVCRSGSPMICGLRGKAPDHKLVESLRSTWNAHLQAERS